MTTAFKTGDKVEYVEYHDGRKAGTKATVLLGKDSPNEIITVEDEFGIKNMAYARRFKLVEEKPFTYADIQVGDKIRRTRTYKTGELEVREGTVTRKASGYLDGGSAILAYDTDDAKSTVTLELLERPEPPKPAKPWDYAKPGDVLFRLYKDGVKDTFIKKANGGWTIFYPAGGTFDVGPDEKLSGYFLGSECVAPQLA